MPWYDPRTWFTRRIKLHTSTPVTMVAAAPRPPRGQVSPVEGRNVPGWVREAWRQYDLCGELRFAARWTGRTVAQARLIAARIDDPSEEPVPLPADHPASQLIADLAGGRVGQSKMLKLMGTQLFVAGDTNLILWDEQEGSEQVQRWEVRTPREVTDAGEGRVQIRVNSATGPTDFILPRASLVVPIREPHPDRATEPDSSVRAVISSLTQIEWATNMITSLTRSRLAIAGLLLLDSGLDFPGRPGVLDPTTGRIIKNPETFWDSLIDATQDWIENPLDPAAGVPMILAGKGEAIKATQLIEFATKTIEKLSEVRAEAIRRLVLGLDIPPEIITGLGQSKFWNASLISEEAVKITTGPVLSTIVDGLTVGWLRPTLKAQGHPGDDLDKIVVWYDLTDLVARPDKAEDMQEAFDRLAVSYAAYRQALGIPESDAPKPDEVAERLRIMLVQRVTPDAATTLQLAQSFGVTLDTPASSAADSGVEPGAPLSTGRPTLPVEAPRDRNGTGQSAGQIPAQTTRGTEVVAHAMVAHALQYVGQRYMKGLGRAVHRLGVDPENLYLHRPVPVEAIDGLMKGCWDGQWSVLPNTLIASVDAHVRDLLRTAAPYDPQQPPVGVV